MAARKKTHAGGPALSPRAVPRSLKLAEAGINTAQDFANVMATLMGDLVSNRIAPNVANAMCNAGGKLLKAVEMQLRYGTASQDVPGKKVLVLAQGNGKIQAPAA
jgi:hypothetical protein